MAGGLLVAVATVGTWWAGTGTADGPRTSYLVAARTLGPGERVERDDLTSVAVDLPPVLARSAFTDAAHLVGSVAVGPIEAGELLQAGAVADGSGSARARELSFVVDRDWAVAGTLVPGDRIDLWVTYGDGPEAETSLVLRRAVVRRASDDGGEGLGATRDQTITVALPSLDDVRSATNAARAGEVTVTRSTDADEDEDEDAGSRIGDGDDEASTTRPGAPTTTRPSATTTTRRGGG